ncbi:hypothetical protein ACQJBY_047614 [Aegilops geniculata]
MEHSGPAAQAQPHACLVFCVSLSHGKEGGAEAAAAAIRLRAAATDPACSSVTTTAHLDPRSTAGRRAACSALLLRQGSGSPRPQIHRRPSCRPCPLAQQHVGITVRKPRQRFQLMNEVCYDQAMASICW